MHPSSTKYAAVFLLLSLSGMWLAWAVNSPAAWLLIGWAVAAFALVGAAYACRQPGWLGKRRDGSIATTQAIVLLPYRLLSEASFTLVRLFSARAAWCEVQPGLFWGRRLTAGESSSLHVDGILDLTAEFPASTSTGGEARTLVPMLDGTAPSPAGLATAVQALTDHLASGSAYVHCAMGHGRSGLVVAAYLLGQQDDARSDDVIAELRKLRPGFSLSPGQRSLLGRFDQSNAH